MVQKCGTDNLHHDDSDCDHVGVKRIGGILRQLIDARGWPPLPVTTHIEGNRPGAEGDDPWHGVAWPDPRDQVPFGRVIRR